MKLLLSIPLLALCGVLHAETRSCHSEWQQEDADYEVVVLVRLENGLPAGFSIQTFVSWDQNEEGDRQVFSAYVNSDSLVDETVSIDDDGGSRRFRLHPEGFDDTVVRIRRQDRDVVVDVDEVSRYHRGMATFPSHAVVGPEPADCQVRMFDP